MDWHGEGGHIHIWKHLEKGAWGYEIRRSGFYSTTGTGFANALEAAKAAEAAWSEMQVDTSAWYQYD